MGCWTDNAQSELGRDGLRLRIHLDDDGTAELEAAVQSRGYRGIGSAWFNLAELSAFADALEAFPLTEEARCGLAGGYWSTSRRGELEQVHLAISAYPIDAAGHLAVQVRVAAPLQAYDRPSARHAAEVELRTTYADLERFARAFRSLIAGERDEAFLAADEGA